MPKALPVFVSVAVGFGIVTTDRAMAQQCPVYGVYCGRVTADDLDVVGAQAVERATENCPGENR
jgi:hypothetical protein